MTHVEAATGTANSTERTDQKEKEGSSVDDGLGENPGVVPPSASRHQVKVHLGDRGHFCPEREAKDGRQPVCVLVDAVEKKRLGKREQNRRCRFDRRSDRRDSRSRQC